MYSKYEYEIALVSLVKKVQFKIPNSVQQPHQMHGAVKIINNK